MKKFFKPMMQTAQIWANMSYAVRRKVGAVLSTTDGRILATGYNGTISGQPNEAETKTPCPICKGSGYWSTKSEPFNSCGGCDSTGFMLETKEEVLHAEMNVLTFCAKNGIPTNDTIMFITLSPCTTCAKLMAQSGIKQVYFLEEYRDPSGIDFLERIGVKCEQIKI